MAKLLNHAGVDWTFSTKGYESTNFGYLAGKADIAKLMVTRIVEAAEESAPRPSSSPNAATPMASCAGPAPTCWAGRCLSRCCTSPNSWRS